MRAASISDYRALAKARLPHFLFEYVDGGSYDEVTLERNVAGLRAIALRQRVLRDVSNIDTSTELFGHCWSLPVGLGPVGLSGLYARRGEVQATRAAKSANVPFTLSTVSACSVEEVARAEPGFWFQLYFVRDRGFVEAMIRLERNGTLEYRNEQWYFRGLGYPAEKVNIRSVSDQIVSLVDTKNNFKTIEEIEATTAMQRCYEGAIYLHQGESYLITKLDLEAGAAYCKPVDVDFYTEVRENGETRILKSLRERAVGAGLAPAHYGDVRVTEQIVGYRRKRQFTEEVLATIDLDYPPQLFDTKAVWWDIPEELIRKISREGCDLAGSLHAAEHACIGLLPLFAMCDRWDIGGLSILLHPDTGKPQIFIYDGFPGGIGITEKAFALLESLWTATLETIEQCPCEFGCPSCVQSPKCGNNNEPLDKKGAVVLLRGLLGKK